MNIQIFPAGVEDTSLVQKIFQASPGYFLRTEGTSVLQCFAEKEMTAKPPLEKQTPSYEKVFCLCYFKGEPIGVIDFHKDHPEVGITYIGLMLIEDGFQKMGIGRSTYLAAEQYAVDKLNCKKLILGISEQNNVEGFWSKMGFRPNGKRYKWEGAKLTNQVFEMEKITG